MMRLAVGRRDMELSARTILVDDTPWIGRALNLDHHAGHRTPESLIGDVATKVVWNALRQGLDTNEYDRVAIRHFDTDGCLATWMALNPEQALERVEVLLAAARFGDFYEGNCGDENSTDGVKLSYCIQEHLSETASADTSRTSDFFDKAFEIIPRFLRQPGSLENGWGKHFTKFNEDLEWLEQEKDSIERSDEVVMIETDRKISLGALMSRYSSPFVVTFTASPSGFHYVIILRPRFSWGYSADAVGSIPIADLKPVYRVLHRCERQAGGTPNWAGVNYDRTIWRLETRGSGSRLAPEALRRRLCESLAKDSSDEDSSEEDSSEENVG
jgi:hypothetical protein